LNFNPEPGPDGVLPRYYRGYFQPRSNPLNQPKTPVTSPNYDYSRCSRATLEKLAKDAEDSFLKRGHYDPDLALSLDAVRAEAKVKTLAEYDAEIGALLREKLSSAGFWLGSGTGDALLKLVNNSRGAK
jgi:hypothetical protein